MFRRLRRPGMVVRVLGPEGRQLDMAQRDWWEQAQRVEITVGEDRISYLLIDKKNVLLLLQE